MSPGRKINLLWLLGIVLAAALAFEPALFNTYTFDDVHQVRDQVVPSTPGDWLRAAAAPWWPPERQKNLWRPVTRLSILAQKSLHPSAAWPFYAFNIALHGAVCAMLFLLARRLGLGSAAAGLGALLFAVHPFHAEAVHQVVGRAELLAAFWMLAGLILFLQFGPRDIRSWILQPLCFALALGSKEHALIYPFLVWLIVLSSNPAAPGRGGMLASWCSRPLWGMTGLLLLILGLFFAAKAAITGGLLESPASVPYYENPLASMPLARRIPAALGVFGYAASRFIFPFHLSPDYSAWSLPVERGWGWPWAWAGLLLLLAILIFIAQNFRSGRRGWALAAAGLGSYALISNGLFTIGVITAQRLWYWPSAPLCLAAGWLFVFAFNSAFRIPHSALRIAILSLLALGLLLVGVAWKDAAAWRSPEAFARATIAVFPASWRGQVDTARACYREKDFEAGVAHARAAIAAFPNQADGWAWLGSCAMFIPARHAEAEAAFRRALSLNPSLYETRRHYAHLLIMQGRRAEAAAQFEAFLASPSAPAAEKEKVRRELESLDTTNTNERMAYRKAQD